MTRAVTRAKRVSMLRPGPQIYVRIKAVILARNPSITIETMAKTPSIKAEDQAKYLRINDPRQESL